MQKLQEVKGIICVLKVITLTLSMGSIIRFTMVGVVHEHVVQYDHKNALLVLSLNPEPLHAPIIVILYHILSHLAKYIKIHII